MTDWEKEVRWRRYVRDLEPLTPYREMARWRRRCLLSLLVNLLLAAALLIVTARP